MSSAVRRRLNTRSCQQLVLPAHFFPTIPISVRQRRRLRGWQLLPRQRSLFEGVFGLHRQRGVVLQKPLDFRGNYKFYTQAHILRIHSLPNLPDDMHSCVCTAFVEFAVRTVYHMNRYQRFVAFAILQ